MSINMYKIYMTERKHFDSQLRKGSIIPAPSIRYCHLARTCLLHDVDGVAKLLTLQERVNVRQKHPHLSVVWHVERTSVKLSKHSTPTPTQYTHTVHPHSTPTPTQYTHT